ncbi:helix-turn-helix domain-containing protein [Streptantibioticus cattleyicolor]|nr:helix-turn-helix domain-containing protein [Streptantibioticus cattleyicolor]
MERAVVERESGVGRGLGGFGDVGVVGEEGADVRELGALRLSVLSFAAAPRVRGGVSGGVPAWQVAMVACGSVLVASRRGAARLEAGDLVLWEPGQSIDRAVAAVEGPAPRVLVLHLPDHLLPVSPAALRELTARPVRSERGAAACLARVLEEFGRRGREVAAAEEPWLARAAADLAAAFVAGLAGTPTVGDNGPGPAAVPDRQGALLRDVMAYIERHLSDPLLSPGTIAAAHHISVRYLHRLFQRERSTVSGYVRDRRLERCRADLADPALAAHSVSRIRTGWGFRDAAAFSRTFKRTYGMAPSEYRRLTGTGTGTGSGPGAGGRPGR